MNVRPEDDDADNRRPDCSDQDRPSGNILGVPNEGMKILDGSVREQLQGSIQRFGCPHGTRRNHNKAPFRRGESEDKPCRRHEYCDRRVYPCVVLRTQDVSYPVESVPHALHSSGEFKRTTHGTIATSVLVLAGDEVSARMTHAAQLDRLSSVVSF